MGKQKLAVKVDDLTVAYNYKPVLWDIDLAIPEGVMMAIVGPNGAGKSTLIKAILGIIDPTMQIILHGSMFRGLGVNFGTFFYFWCIFLA